MKNLFYKCLLLMLLAFSGLGTFAQTDLQNAKKEYDLGRLEQAEKTLIEGLSNGGIVEKQDEKEAYKLLAFIYLEMDSVDHAKLYAEKILNKEPWFEASTDSPMQFKKLIATLKVKPNEPVVTSVSKNPESLYKAPATVILITDSVIANRGYNDLEELFHDIPGFDISRGNGINYAHLYQRGYRSATTNRILLIIDGVEQNDLWSNAIRVSRQYPLSNIKSVEVVYGPASTIYGANAFLGVISIITKDAVDISKKYPNEKGGVNFGVTGQIMAGSYQSRALDLTTAVTSKDDHVSGYVSFRYFESRNNSLSNYPGFDFASIVPGDSTNNTYYNNLKIENPDASQKNMADSLDPNNVLYTYDGDSNLIPTQVGIDRARSLDNHLYNRLDYENISKSYYVNTKVKIYDFTIGFESQIKHEGPGAWFTDLKYGGTNSGFSWSSFNTNMYVLYDKKLSEAWMFVNLLRYKNNGVQDPTNLSSITSYFNGRLDLFDALESNPTGYSNSYRDIHSNQFRNESRFIFNPSEKFNLITAIDLRKSAIQGEYVKSSVPFDSVPNSTSITSDHFFSNDFGVYAQANYVLKKQELKFTAGGRADYNKVWYNDGYNWVFNPRLAVIYSPDKFVLKGIFATAFKDASNQEKYATFAARTSSDPGLEPEKVINFEFSARYFIKENFHIEAVYYKSKYSNAVEEVEVTPGFRDSLKFGNVGIREIQGGFVSVNYAIGKLSAYLNYTFTDPKSAPEKDVALKRIGDIASHQFNIGGNYKISKKWNANLRGNFVGKRLTGPNTTVPGNDLTFDPYFLLSASVRYTFDKKEKIGVQLTVNNLFDHQYSSPGLRAANGVTYSKHLPQNGINGNLRMYFNF